ncbi:MAG: DUF1553 domain-containing protein [Planctomycetota bacterium]
MQNHRFLWVTLLVAGSVTGSRASKGSDSLPTKIDFGRDIRPILAEYCLQCHGPDGAQRQADLRLDQSSDATRRREHEAPIVPGKPGESGVLHRLVSNDPDLQMPPPDFPRRPSKRDVETLRAWIEQGAEYQPHWAFQRPRRPPTPHVKEVRWTQNPVDSFILARLEAEGLTPTRPADKTTLLRRVTLDLTGLPPTPEETDAFLSDKSERAYEKVVDRLLASPRYGERMAAEWLEIARYADTNGYQNDGNRSMWRWRDWVIDAHNRNLPFDRFTVEQLAGDLLPKPTLEQRIATGFNRNHRGNSEGGIIPEEYQVEYVVDRVDTMATTWLGLTLGCARCHDHKYDPLTQREFYRVYAYFNNLAERGRVVREGNSPPFISAPTEEMKADLQRIETDLADAESKLAKLESASPSMATLISMKIIEDWSISDGLVVHFPFQDSLSNFADLKSKPIETAVDGNLFSQGIIGKSLRLDGKRQLPVGQIGDLDEKEKFSFSIWVRPEQGSAGTLFAKMDADLYDVGYELALVGGRVRVGIVNRTLDDALRVESVNRLKPANWHHLLASYDGSKFAAGVRIYIDGKPVKTRILSDNLNNNIGNDQPLRLGEGGTAGPFRGEIDDLRIFKRELAIQDAVVLACADTISTIAKLQANERSEAQAAKLRMYYLSEVAPEETRVAYARVRDLMRQREKLLDSIPTVMVMEEQATPRETFILDRGQYDRPGEKVQAGVPEIFPPLPEGSPNNRLGLAFWLVDPRHPLTARVAVNRYWQMLFGTGLVRTPEDFGTQGEPPSHPELLDWLATDFVSSGWDVKRLIKLLVLSATYRQHSALIPHLSRVDPENRLFARGARFRLTAGTIRDQALAISGLLVEKVGGPSVRPYQPAGLWTEVTSAGADYKQDHGEALYRRSMYTFWKRTVAPPAMTTFDAATRETCIVRKSRTNTPLQALVLLNDPTFVEAARGLAGRMLRHPGKETEKQISFGFQLATGRPPREEERATLASSLQEYLTHFKADPAAAKRLVQVGESKLPEEIDVPLLAAYTLLANTLLNLDEVVTRE